MIGMLLVGVAAAGEGDAAFELSYVDPGIAARWGWGELHVETFGDAVVRGTPNPADGDALDRGIHFDIFLTGTLWQRTRVLWEAVSDFRTDPVGLGAPDTHRLWVAYTFADAAQLKLGAEHSAISWWTRHYHHGSWLETAITRPYIARYASDGGILPIHAHALELNGRAPVGAGHLGYVVAAEPIGAFPDTADFAHQMSPAGLAWTAALGWEAGGELPLSVGAAGFTRELTDDAGAVDARQWIATAHVVVRPGDGELVTEGACLWDVGATGVERSQSAYVQGSWRFGRVTPYLRFDYRGMALGDVHLDEPGDVATHDLDLWEVRGGGRVDLTRNVAVKVEGSAGREERRDDAGEVGTVTSGSVGTQLSWVF